MNLTQLIHMLYIYLFMIELDTYSYKVTYRPNGPGAHYICFVLLCIVIIYAHVTIIKYLLSYLLTTKGSG